MKRRDILSKMDTRIKQVIFNAEEHSYTYLGRSLHGITGAIGKMVGKSFPDTVVVQASTIYGHDVHSESERWIKDKRDPSTESGKWVVEELKKFAELHNVRYYEAELIVSDFETTASCIDIVAHTPEGAYLFDIKTTSKFDRLYCSLQLSAYKRLYTQCYGEEVLDMYVIGTKSKRLYHILEQDKSKVDRLFTLNKEK